MSSPTTISSLNNSYCNQIVDIILPIQQIEFQVPITLNDQPDLFDIESNYHGTGGNFWGAKVDGQLVGTIALIAFDGQEGAIRKMFVRKEFRGKEFGIAQLLLNELIAYSKSKGITALYLGTVDMLKAAHRFYERNGFTRLDQADLPTAFPRMSADTIFYWKPLVN